MLSDATDPETGRDCRVSVEGGNENLIGKIHEHDGASNQASNNRQQQTSREALAADDVRAKDGGGHGFGPAQSLVRGWTISLGWVGLHWGCESTYYGRGSIVAHLADWRSDDACPPCRGYSQPWIAEIYRADCGTEVTSGLYLGNGVAVVVVFMVVKGGVASQVSCRTPVMSGSRRRSRLFAS